GAVLKEKEDLKLSLQGQLAVKEREMADKDR
ncbi:MAG: hypothetical protein JWM47_4166, partial [Acidimicrobiales bacterium]|nr:hypothetical protein [Acidimicrobiales bacterium]